MPLRFFTVFTKGNNFCGLLFAALTKMALPDRGLRLGEGICSKRGKVFPLRVGLVWKGKVLFSLKVNWTI